MVKVGTVLGNIFAEQNIFTLTLVSILGSLLELALKLPESPGFVPLPESGLSCSGKSRDIFQSDLSCRS